MRGRWRALWASLGELFPAKSPEAGAQVRWLRRTALERRCFRILNAKSFGVTITLADITEEEFRVLELIETERQEQIKTGDSAGISHRRLHCGPSRQ
jgi:hypothetical protein